MNHLKNDREARRKKDSETRKTNDRATTMKNACAATMKNDCEVTMKNDRGARTNSTEPTFPLKNSWTKRNVQKAYKYIHYLHLFKQNRSKNTK